VRRLEREQASTTRTIDSVSKPTAVIRNAAAVVRDVCSRDLPERTVASGGLSQRDARDDTREWQDGPMPHPYVPADVDVWLRERT
jgi:hypothetical protein